MNRVLLFIVALLGLSACVYGQSQQYIDPNNLAQVQGVAAAAQSAKDAAVDHITQLMNQLTAAFHDSPEYVKAKADADTSQVASDKARAAAIDRLSSSDAYKDALAAKDAAVKALQDARDAGTTGIEVANLAQAKMAAGTVVSRLESAALANDNDYTTAHKVFLDAASALRAMEAKFRTECAAKPEVQSAKEAVIQATAAASAANAAAIALQRQQDQARIDKANADARAQQQYNQSQQFRQDARR